jgi:hypothetical protein
VTLDVSSYEKDFKKAVNSFGRSETEQLCRQLVTDLRAADESFDPDVARRILGHLQRKRYFDLLQRVADAFQQTGLQTPGIRKQYAQALIDQGLLSAAVPYLERLAKQTEGQPEDAYEHSGSRGLLGRAYKQIYVDLASPGSPEAIGALNQAIGCYRSVYRGDPAEYSWHGINTVALLHRAAVDGIPVHGISDPDWRAILLAQEILQRMTVKWDNGTACRGE